MDLVARGTSLLYKLDITLDLNISFIRFTQHAALYMPIAYNVYGPICGHTVNTHHNVHAHWQPPPEFRPKRFR